MKTTIIIALVLSASGIMAQAKDAAPYLGKIPKYNESSSFEDSRYKELTWEKFYKLDEANDIVDPMNYDFDLMNAAMYFAVNKYRASRNLAPLVFEPRLRDAATIHTDQMIRRNFFNHVNESVATLQNLNNRTELCGYTGERIAENLARSYMDMQKPLSYTQLADKVVGELSKSKEHNAHMLDPSLDKLGCTALFEANSKDGFFYFKLTQDFGRDWR